MDRSVFNTLFFTLSEPQPINTLHKIQGQPTLLTKHAHRKSYVSIQVRNNYNIICLPIFPPIKKQLASWGPIEVGRRIPPFPFFQLNMSRAASSPLTAALAKLCKSLKHSENKSYLFTFCNFTYSKFKRLATCLPQTERLKIVFSDCEGPYHKAAFTWSDGLYENLVLLRCIRKS